jgi:hypothetical protein
LNLKVAKLVLGIVQINFNAWLGATTLALSLPVASVLMLIVAELTLKSIGASVPGEEATALALAVSMPFGSSGRVLLQASRVSLCVFLDAKYADFLHVCSVSKHSSGLSVCLVPEDRPEW